MKSRREIYIFQYSLGRSSMTDKRCAEANRYTRSDISSNLVTSIDAQKYSHRVRGR